MKDLIETLSKYGLSPSEAKAYIALVTYGLLNAKILTKIYSVLNSLIKKAGFIKIENLFKLNHHVE